MPREDQGLGVEKYKIEYSIDGYNYSALGSGENLIPENLRWRFMKFDLDTISELNNNELISFRIYGYGAKESQNSWGFDDIRIRGDRDFISLSSDLLTIESIDEAYGMGKLIFDGNEIADDVQFITSLSFSISFDGINFEDTLVLSTGSANGQKTLFVKYDAVDVENIIGGSSG